MTRKERALVVLICVGVTALVLLGVWSLRVPVRRVGHREPDFTDTHADYGAPGRETASVGSLTEQPTPYIEVEMPDEQVSGGSIEGRVFGEGGKGLFAVVVTALRLRTPVKDTITDENGEYMIRGLPAGSYNMLAEREGYALAGRRDIKVFADQATSGVDFELVPGGTFAGRVVDMNEEPIPDTNITMYALGVRDDSRGLVRSFRATTDSKGEFRIESIPPGEYHALAQHGSYLPSERTAVVIEEAEPASYKFVLELGGSISGTVTNLDGEPVADVQVWLSSAQENLDFSRGTRTDAEGKYVLGGLRSGTVNLRVLARGFVSSTRKDIEVLKGRVVEGIDFQLDRGSALCGVVVAPGGEPVKNATISASDTKSYITQKTDEKGAFTLSGFAGDHVNLSVRAPGYVLLIKRNVPVNTNDLRLVLSRGGVVEGRAISDAPIKPTFSVVLYTIPEGGTRRRIVRQKVFRDPEGRFKVDDIPPGRYTLEVHGMRYIQVEPEIVEVTEGASVSGLEIPLRPRRQRR